MKFCLIFSLYQIAYHQFIKFKASNFCKQCRIRFTEEYLKKLVKHRFFSESYRYRMSSDLPFTTEMSNLLFLLPLHRYISTIRSVISRDLDRGTYWLNRLNLDFLTDLYLGTRGLEGLRQRTTRGMVLSHPTGQHMHDRQPDENLLPILLLYIYVF